MYIINPKPYSAAFLGRMGNLSWLVTLIYEDKEHSLCQNAERKERSYKGKECQAFDPLKLNWEPCGKPVADKERDRVVAMVAAVAVYMRMDLLYNQDLQDSSQKDF